MIFILLSISLIGFILLNIYKNTTKHIRFISDEASNIAQTDGLTGLLNRHYLNRYINKPCSTFLANQEKFIAVAFLDIDFFKKVNDTYGHDIGDCVLVQFANKLKAITREKDIVCRYGGEEFLLIMKNIKKQTAIEKLESIREEIENMELECDSELKNITISIGLSFGKDEILGDVIKQADNYLYQAKENGRNQVVFEKIN